MMLVGALQVRAAKMLLIGSSALQESGFDIGRKPADIDMLTSPDGLEHFKKSDNWDSYIPTSESKWVFRKAGKIYEVEVAWPGSSGELILNRAGSACLATPAICLMLKLSHRYLKNSPHFLKTMRDIQLIRAADVVLDDELQDILRLREQETYWYEHPNLNRTKDEFFVDVYQFDHDSLHDAVALMDDPAYTNFQKSEVEVDCDMNKFMEQPIDIQLAAVYEEAAVLALERSFIPHGRDQRWAFAKALEKVCSSITSGRFREFAWEHYDDVMELKSKVEPLYTVSFFEGIVNGTVKKWNENG